MKKDVRVFTPRKLPAARPNPYPDQVRWPTGPAEAMGRRLRALAEAGFHVDITSNPASGTFRVMIERDGDDGEIVQTRTFDGATVTSAVQDAYLFACGADATLSRFTRAVAGERS